jgi:hypothetical protein
VVTGSKTNQSNVDNLNNVRHTSLLKMAALRSFGMLAAQCQHGVNYQKTGIFSNSDFDHDFQEASIEIEIL